MPRDRQFWGRASDVVAVNEQTALVKDLGQTTTKPTAGTEHRGTAPVLAEPPNVTDVFGTMQIPRFGTDYNRPIGEGTNREKVLNTIGLGHYQDTAVAADILPPPDGTVDTGGGP